MERVYSIGGRALFVGKRCITIHADSFPSINANSVYYTKEEEYDGIWYMYDLAQDKEERIVESSICIYPASILQLLLEYTMCSPLYQPPWARLAEYLDFDLSEQMILQMAEIVELRMDIPPTIADDEYDNFVFE